MVAVVVASALAGTAAANPATPPQPDMACPCPSTLPPEPDVIAVEGIIMDH